MSKNNQNPAVYGGSIKAKLVSAPDSKEPMLSGPKIARILDVDPATIRRWRKEKAPHHLIGEGLIRYRLSEIVGWRATRKSIKSTDKAPAK
jgi:transposase-like protein